MAGRDLKTVIQKAFALPLHEVAQKAVRFLAHELQANSVRLKDTWSATYAGSFPKEGFFSYSIPAPSKFSTPKGAFCEVTNNYLVHRFNHLGSGWVSVHRGVGCRGMEGQCHAMGEPGTVDRTGLWLAGSINRHNRRKAREVWALVDVGYAPIDWQLDCKSGYRWQENTWYRDIKYGHKPGVDIKVPWELARMHHLTALAFAFASANRGEESLRPAGECGREFRNQLLDFIAHSPPRFGVNWACTMDVAIRIANWLMAYSLFRSFGARFDHDFEEVFARSVYEHGLHIINNLEWAPHFRSNHYLANIAGLLFVAAHLPQTAETDAWLAFAVQVLIEEVAFQFNPDGSNFEASTCYHRLSSEIVVYATALVLGLPAERKGALKLYPPRLVKGRPALRPGPLPHYWYEGLKNDIPFPRWYLERLERMAEFTMHITRPDGRVPQIGDNDSGRFLKIQPVFTSMLVGEAKARYLNLNEFTDLPDGFVHLEEDHLDHRHLVAAINGLFGRKDFADFTGGISADTEVIRSLAGGVCLPSSRSGEPEGMPAEGPRLFACPDFGLYVFSSPKVYLAVRCGSVGQHGRGGHAHNDQLSFELALEGKSVIVDPGTYLYTPAPEERNRFRSSASHNALVFPGREPGAWEEGLQGLFRLRDTANAKLIDAGPELFCGEHRGFGAAFRRTVRIADAGISGTDECAEKGERYLCFHFAPGLELSLSEDGNTVFAVQGDGRFALGAAGGHWRIEDYRFSPAYGVIEKAQRAVFETRSNKIDWRITTLPGD